MAEETYAPKSPDLSSFSAVPTLPNPPPQPLPGPAHTTTQTHTPPQQQHHYNSHHHQSHARNHNRIRDNDPRRYSWHQPQQHQKQLSQASPVYSQQPSPPHHRQQSLDHDYRYASHASNQHHIHQHHSPPGFPQQQQQQQQVAASLHDNHQAPHQFGTPVKSERTPPQVYITPQHQQQHLQPFAQLAPQPSPPHHRHLGPALSFVSPTQGQAQATSQFIPPSYAFKPVPSAYPQGPTPIDTNSDPLSAMPPRKSAQPAPAPPAIEPSPVRTKFPTARIKRIMQADEEVGKVAQQTPIAVGKALELFMIHMVSKSADIAREKNSRRVTAQMLKQVIETDGQYDFLADIVAKVGEEEKKGRSASGAKAETDSSDEEMEQPEPKKKTRATGGRKKKAPAS